MIKYEMLTENKQTGVNVAVHFSGPSQAIKEISQMNMFVIDRMITTFLQDKVDTPELPEFIEVFKKQLCENIMSTDTLAVHKQLANAKQPVAKTDEKPDEADKKEEN